MSDPTGAVAPNASVNLTSTETGFNETTTTGATGTFRFALVKPGDYTLTVTLSGFAKCKQSTQTQRICLMIWAVASIPAPALKKPEELTVRQVAKQFVVNDTVVHYRIEHGMIQARRLNRGMPYWITPTRANEQKLRDWVRNSAKIHTAS